MQTKRLLSALIFSCLLPLLAFADVWQDPKTKVNYKYDVNESTASVCKSEDALGDIAILPWITVDDKEYEVHYIGEEAFDRCTGLTSVTIPEGVHGIDLWAFRGCTGLTSVTIPNSVFYFGSWAFEGCTGLASVTIPEGVTFLYRTFIGCSGLTSVTIPSGVTSIDGAFIGCTSLTSITIPSSVTSLDASFSGCTSLTSVNIPEGVTSIDWAFNDCTSLTSITIPSSVTSIGESAFKGCTSLTNIKIPSRVTRIGKSAFEGCTGLTSISIPSSVDSIGNWAFADCLGLTSVTIPSSVTSIGYAPFTDLTSISVKEGNKVYDSRNNCNAIIETKTNTLICGCINTVIPSSVDSIGNYAFEGCTSLTNIKIPSSVTRIGKSAFNGCTGLTSITIPSSVDSIGDWAFADCLGLTSVTIPSSVTSIGYATFYRCNLTSVTIPSTVTSIGEYAFYDCIELTSVTSLIKDPFNIGKSVFEHYPYYNYIFTHATLYVPKGTKAKYEDTPAWNMFEKIEEIGVSPQPKGDVNGDQAVNVADIAIVIDVMAKSTNDTSADVNKDGKVDVADIGNIIDIMAGNDSDTQPEEKAYTSCPDENHPHWIDLGIGTQWQCCNEGASRPEEYGGYYTFGQVASAPTSDQIMALVDNCSYNWTTQNGVYGDKFTGPNGGTIFLPAAGGVFLDGELLHVGSYGFYWSSTPYDDAYGFGFDSGDAYWSNRYYRYLGFTVRPVR